MRGRSKRASSTQLDELCFAKKTTRRSWNSSCFSMCARRLRRVGGVAGFGAHGQRRAGVAVAEVHALDVEVVEVFLAFGGDLLEREVQRQRAGSASSVDFVTRNVTLGVSLFLPSLIPASYQPPEMSVIWTDLLDVDRPGRSRRRRRGDTSRSANGDEPVARAIIGEL